MKKLKSIRDYLTVVWVIGFVARIISKTTHLFEIPKWFGYLIIATVLIVIGLSIFIYVIEKRNKKTP
tara:strand:- start:37 stop:237 length:201 start_codon:yes stop_codon:yes gene_type:complete